jgi:hypothetical protein
MSLILELPPALAARLSEEAAHRGISTEAFARTLLEDALGWPGAAPEGGRPSRKKLTFEEWEREFDAMLEECRDLELPDLPDEAFRRENMYEDRGL